MSEQPVEQLQQLSHALGLQFETQDWGIINADPNRLREFVSYYEEQKLTPEIQFQMFELILASGNEVLNSYPAESDQFRHFVSFFAKHRDDFPDQISYWASLQDEEFPLATYINNLQKEN